MRHIPIWENGQWICMRCDWHGETDEDAHNHYHTGMEQIMDALGVPD